MANKTNDKDDVNDSEMPTPVVVETPPIDPANVPLPNPDVSAIHSGYPLLILVAQRRLTHRKSLRRQSRTAAASQMEDNPAAAAAQRMPRRARRAGSERLTCQTSCSFSRSKCKA